MGIPVIPRAPDMTKTVEKISMRLSYYTAYSAMSPWPKEHILRSLKHEVNQDYRVLWWTPNEEIGPYR